LVPEHRLDASRQGVPKHSIGLSPLGGNPTSGRASPIHGDRAARDKHQEMGFFDGSGAALDQLVEVAKAMR
jgi:hypothetical protein